MKAENIHINGRAIPNQIIISDGEKKIFVSYDSVIAIKENGKIKLGINWDYSKTTGKYRNLFLGENKKETLKKIESGEYTVENL